MKKIILSFTGIFFLTIFAIAQQPFVNYTDQNGLPDNTVNGVAVDAAGNPWFATLQGIGYFDGANWINYTTQDGLIDDFVNCIAIAPNGDVWAGTDVGVSRFNGTSWISYTTQGGLVNNMVNYIAVEASGIVWFATTNGVSRYDGLAFTSFTMADGLPAPMISYIYIDLNQVKWFCTWMGGVARYDDPGFTVINTSNGLPDNNVTSMVIDTLGNKYFGTYLGLVVFDAQNQYVKTLNHANGLYHDIVKDVAMDSKGNIWVGIFVDYLMEGGISVISGTNTYHYSTNQGLVSVMVERLTSDLSDNVWIATGNGVSHFQGQYLSIDQSTPFNPLMIYPNPATSFVQIQSGSKKPTRCDIVDIHGRAVIAVMLNEGNGTIDLTDIPAGLYLVRASNSQAVYTAKLIRH